MMRVAACKQLNGLVRELHGCSPISPLLLQHYSSTSSSKGAYSGLEILNYMGGLDSGKKKLVQKLVNFRMKQARTDRDGVQIIADALDNVKPICEVAKVRIAGNIYDVPGVVTRDRQQTLAVRWILDAAFKRRTNHSSRLEECLFAETMMLIGRGELHERKGRLFMDLLPPIGVMPISNGGKIKPWKSYF